MVILLNAASTYKGGSEQVFLSFLHECKKFDKHKYVVVLRKELLFQIDEELFPCNFLFFAIDKRPASSIKSFLKVMNQFKSIRKEQQPDCVICTGGHGYWRPNIPLVAGYNMPHFIYPESPYFTEMSLNKRVFWWVKEKIHMWFYSRPDVLFVQTTDVKKRLEEKLNYCAPVRVISNTVNGHFSNPKLFSEKLPKRLDGEIRLLMLSAYYPHKNHKIIRETVKELKKKDSSTPYKFVVTLPASQYEHLFSGCFGYVINVGPIPIVECPSLYKECDFMFLPTLLECFSASYIEAMLMQKPILTSDLGFAHTVCKDAAVYFNPTSPADIADKIIGLAENLKLQEILASNGAKIASEIGTPLKRAKSILSLCEELVNKTSQN